MTASNTPEPSRDHHLTWNGTEWVDDRCGCRYHPDDDNGSHGGAPHVHLCERHAESEPAPPTDGPTLSEKTEASWYLALEESRAEVERLQGDYMHACGRLSKERDESSALRDRVRVLEALVERAMRTDADDIEGWKAIRRALSTTQEPPASKDDHGKR